MRLSEHEAQKRAERSEASDRRLTKCRELLMLAEEANLPVFVRNDPRVIDRTDYAKFRDGLRSLLEKGIPLPLGIECDHCGTELVNHEPGVLLLSSPPRKPASCVGCGWIGSVEA